MPDREFRIPGGADHRPSGRDDILGCRHRSQPYPGVVTTVGPRYFPAGPNHPAIALAEVYPTGSPQAVSTSNLITHLRDSVIPAAERDDPHLQVLVGGQTALADDLTSQLASKLPLFVGMVVALSFILLMIVFRSLATPATAALINLLSAAAAFGVVVAVFQWGWFSTLVGVTNTGPISPFIPILMFAVLFGLTTVSYTHLDVYKRQGHM